MSKIPRQGTGQVASETIAQQTQVILYRLRHRDFSKNGIRKSAGFDAPIPLPYPSGNSIPYGIQRALSIFVESGAL